jgi:hypothetical protein
MNTSLVAGAITFLCVLAGLLEGAEDVRPTERRMLDVNIFIL